MGEFASAAQAAAAHKVDRGTIHNRCATDPENYQKIVTEYQKPTFFAGPKRTQWPLTWAHYRTLDNSERELIYTKWCQGNCLDPEAESTTDRFFSEMDAITDSGATDETDVETDLVD